MTFPSVGGLTAADVSAQIASEAASPVKAWAYFEQVGTHTIFDSMNVSTITDVGVGQSQLDFITPMNNANYAGISGGLATSVQFVSSVNTKTTTSCKVQVFRQGVAYDSATMDMAVFSN